MNQPLTLDFDDPMSGNYRRTDPISSVVAARTVNAEAQRGRILAVLRHARRPMYSAEIAAKTDIPTGEVNSRLASMKRRGEVKRLDEMGSNRRGQPVYLWEAAPASSVDVRTELV